MLVDDVARQYYVARQLLARRAVLATRRLWAQVDQKAIRATWHGQVGPAVERMLTAAQAEAASTADRYIAAALKAQGKPDSAEAAVNSAAFAGTASDGRDLATLLELSNVYALQQIQQGATPSQGLAVGGRWLAQTVGTQVLDASRAANSVAITTRRHVTGFIRVTNGPACARCAILAGRWYRWNADFERHTNCQCGQVPADDEDSQGMRADPMQMFAEGKITGLSAAETQAVQDGADLASVVNAHRGMYSVGGRTREGVTKRGFAGYRMRSLGVTGGRLTPEAIYAQAASRSEAIDLLYRYGYIT
ncbi:MAG TPA: hypothetical protein VN088_08470 [Nocardioides sp.]|nr:hypothetical protein [Nocardioides sp.]